MSKIVILWRKMSEDSLQVHDKQNFHYLLPMLKIPNINVFASSGCDKSTLLAFQNHEDYVAFWTGDNIQITGRQVPPIIIRFSHFSVCRDLFLNNLSTCTCVVYGLPHVPAHTCDFLSRTRDPRNLKNGGNKMAPRQILTRK